MDPDERMIEYSQLQAFEPLSSLSPDRLKELSSRASVDAVRADETIYENSLLGVQAIYLLEGRVDVTLSSDGGTRTQIIAAGSVEARQSLVGFRYSRATTVTDSVVVRVDNEVLDIMLAWEQLAAVETRAAESNSEIDNSKFLNKYHKSFRQIPVANINRLFKLVEPVPYKEGEVVIREGDEGDYFYLVEFGKVSVTRQSDDGGEIELAELGEGASFGEDALLTNNPRNATITMVTDGVLMRLGKDAFLGLLKEPDLDWLSPVDAQAAINAGARWLDVRYPVEYRQARLAQALNIPLQDLSEHKDTLDRRARYVTYCNTGRRSSAAASLLGREGYRVSALRGGIQTLRQPQG